MIITKKFFPACLNGRDAWEVKAGGKLRGVFPAEADADLFILGLSHKFTPIKFPERIGRGDIQYHYAAVVPEYAEGDDTYTPWIVGVPHTEGTDDCAAFDGLILRAAEVTDEDGMSTLMEWAMKNGFDVRHSYYGHGRVVVPVGNTQHLIERTEAGDDKAAERLEQIFPTLEHEGHCARKGHGAAECTCVRGEAAAALSAAGRAC